MIARDGKGGGGGAGERGEKGGRTEGIQAMQVRGSEGNGGGASGIRKAGGKQSVFSLKFKTERALPPVFLPSAELLA